MLTGRGIDRGRRGMEAINRESAGQTPVNARAIMFLGTGSDVGKSIAATAFCRILRRRGCRVALFKAQNMSNNSYVTVEGRGIGQAQVVQAEAAGLLPSVHMNPILLKPSTELGAQIILQGEVFGQMDAMEYYAMKPRLRQAVLSSYDRLAREYDIIVLEGAWSCCEMNLKPHDLVNFQMAEAAGARCILVADIDRGGVFARIIGTYNLMTRQEQDLTIGFLINKFRGDPGLFLSGIEYIEKKTGKPVLGLISFYRDIAIDSEDEDGYISRDGRVVGTYVHGILDARGFAVLSSTASGGKKAWGSAGRDKDDLRVSASMTAWRIILRLIATWRGLFRIWGRPSPRPSPGERGRRIAGQVFDIFLPAAVDFLIFPSPLLEGLKIFPSPVTGDGLEIFLSPSAKRGFLRFPLPQGEGQGEGVHACRGES